jgi:hypothetical protein
MKFPRSFACWLAVTLSSACGGSPPPADAPEVESAPLAALKEAEEPVPSRCIFRKGACMPPVKWAEKLCEGVYQELALYMFQEGTPWTRFYMRTGLNAVNGWGPTIDEDLVQGEEVLVINYRRQSESFQVEGSLGTYDVLRWNGSCVTLDVGQVTAKAPRSPKPGRIEWRSLGEEMQGALLKAPELGELYEERRKACKGASIGLVTDKCESLDRDLNKQVAYHVRAQRALPKPSSHP